MVTLRTGIDVEAETISPGSPISDRGVFTLTGSGTASKIAITTLTVTLASSGTPNLGLAEVGITYSTATVTYFSAVTSFSSNTVSFSGGTTLPIGTAGDRAVIYKIRLTPLNHANSRGGASSL